MGKAKQVEGKDMMLFTDTSLTEVPAYKALALATGCSMEVTAETKEITSKDSGIWKESFVSKLGWSMSSDNNMSADADVNGYDSLMAAMLAHKAIKVCFGIASNAAIELPDGGWLQPNKSYGGSALITKLSATGPNGDTSTFSVSLEGTGVLSEIAKA